MAKRTRPVEGMQRRYEWRLYPTSEQMKVLREQAGMCADLWNALLSICERRYEAIGQRETRYYYDRHGEIHQAFTGRFLSFHCAACAVLSGRGKFKACEEHRAPSEYDMSPWITAMLAECPEWRSLSTWTPRRVMASFAASLDRFIKGKGGHPRYKSRRRADAIPHRCASGCWVDKSDRHENSWWVYLSGVCDEKLWRRGKGRGDIWARGRLPTDVNEWMDADIRLDDRGATISVAVAIDERRQSYGRLRPVTVRFDLLDGFAVVNDEAVTLPDLIRVKSLDDRRAEMQSDFDLHWPRGKRWTDEEWQERCDRKEEIGRLASKISRIRRNALHVWSCNLVECASVLTIYKPRIKDNTKTPRGDAKKWGANVEIVSDLNRTILSYAPAMAVQMLEYKAKELGIPVEIIEDTKPDIAIGAKLVSAKKAERKANRAIRKNDNECNKQGTGRTGRGDGRGDGIGAGGHEPKGRPEAGPARVGSVRTDQFSRKGAAGIPPEPGAPH